MTKACGARATVPGLPLAFHPPGVATWRTPASVVLAATAGSDGDGRALLADQPPGAARKAVKGTAFVIFADSASYEKQLQDAEALVAAGADVERFDVPASAALRRRAGTDGLRLSSLSCRQI